MTEQSEKFRIYDLPANPGRGLVGLFSILAAVVGAGVLWGFGGALFTGGLFMAIDASTDEVVERITKTTRGRG